LAVSPCTLIHPIRPPLAGCAPEVKFLLLDFPLF
jgi:hypothetical protein